MSKFKELSDAYENPMSEEETMKRLKELARDGGWRQLKKDIIKYNEMRENIVNEMENRDDPVFNRYLKKYKRKLGPEEFDLHRLKVYALCNKHSMSRVRSLDQLVKVVHYPAPAAVPMDQS